MSQKPSRLLSTAKDLIKNNNLHDAMAICEDVINIDPNNINGLLLATKCWMDLDIKSESVKIALERILMLKPNNPTAIQAFRKFYEKYIESYFHDGIKFYSNLFTNNELTDKDYETIVKYSHLVSVSEETEKLLCDMLVKRIKSTKDISAMKKFFQISAENFIMRKNQHYFETFVQLILDFDSNSISSDTDELDYLKAMETLFKANIDRMEPEFFYTLLEKNNLTNIFGYTLFAEILRDHYMFGDCNETLELAFGQLATDETIIHKNSLDRALKIIKIENLIQWMQIDQLEIHWPQDAAEFLPKPLWCQAYAVGFDGFAKSQIKWSYDWCDDMSEHDSIICRALMNGPLAEEIQKQHDILIDKCIDITSFQWLLWSNVLQLLNLLDKREQALHCGSKINQVHYKIHGTLAEIYSMKNEYKLAVDQYWLALEKHFCPDLLEKLVDLHMSEKKYDQPIEILDKLEVENCSESLLEKFVMCLNHLDRVTDAISIAQRLAKQNPSNGHNWQLLGDLYLKRGNINSAFTTYSKSLELVGSGAGIYARMGNVFSMRYQETFDENEFHQSINYFNKSIDLQSTVEAFEGKTSVLYLHAEMSIRQLMLSSAIGNVQDIIDLLVEHHEILNDSEFLFNLLGKTIFLSMNGHIDHAINFSRLVSYISMNSESLIQPYNIAYKCFQMSIRKYPSLAESYYNLALLGLHKLNIQCPGLQRGNSLFLDLYTSVEDNFKISLHLDSSLHNAWKYLGYLYFRHGIASSHHVFDIQHCLSMAIDITSTQDTLKDPESAFLLGLLYIRENWCNLAKELYGKIQMDYSVSPIGHIGMYLLAAQDHTITEQSHIAKAILCYNYRDEESIFDHSCYRINDSIVGLFCDNLGFLANSRCDLESFNNSESTAELVDALKIALNKSWTTFEAYKAIGSPMYIANNKQFSEYGHFLGILELLTGNQHYGKQLLNKTKLDDMNTFMLDLQELHNCWINKDQEQCLALIESLKKHANISSGEELHMDPSRPTRVIDHLLLTAITCYLKSSHSELVTSLQSLLNQLDSISKNDALSLSMQTSIILSIGALILSTNDLSLVNLFVQSTEELFPQLDDKSDSFSRLLARLKLLQSDTKQAFEYLYKHCLKQPYEMDRWLNLLEFALDHLPDLEGLVDISQIFFLTNRPWCFSPFDVERYAKILQRHSTVLTRSALTHQKHMVMRSMKLFPNLCSDFFKSLFY